MQDYHGYIFIFFGQYFNYIYHNSPYFYFNI